MKRKIVVTMSLAFWVDDKDIEEYAHTGHRHDDWLNAISQMDENAIIDMTDEATTIKVEITETKE
jgi:hypothetical protein